MLNEKALNSTEVLMESVGSSWWFQRTGALILSTAMALTGAMAKLETSASAAPRLVAAKTVNPNILSQQADTLVTSTAEAWSNHQTTDGNFSDPVYGRGGGYGVPMIGQALVETGVATSNEQLVQQGIQAEVYEAEHPTNGGFEEFGLASSYIWNTEYLSNNPVWQNAQSTLADSLKRSGRPVVSSGAEACYSNPQCWTNLKLVGAFGNIELQASGLVIPSKSSQLGKIAIRYNGLNKVLTQAAHNTGNDAYTSSRYMNFKDAGILSDPSRDPLAYHQLSTMMLGRVIEALGNRTPAAVTAAFQRSAKAIVGLMAPNGDGAYIGRGQGQVWNVAAEVDALSLAARDTADPVWRGRYLAGAERALYRLDTIYTPGSWGMPLVPRLANDPNPDYIGIDSYANSVEYNGLALWALQDAVEQLKLTKPAQAEGIGADSAGVFVDPSHTKFAAVRHGNLWYAIHAGDTAPDARYDFGLVAAQRLFNGAWTPAMHYRPLTEKTASAGPVLIKNGRHFVPEGRDIRVTSNGTVVINGGWASNPGKTPAPDKHTTWTFKPKNNGVTMSFPSQKSRTYQFQVWHEAGSSITENSKGLKVEEPDGRVENYKFNRPVNITQGPIYHSAYDKNLASSILTVHSPKNSGYIKYTTQF